MCSGIVNLVYSELKIAHPVGRAAWLLGIRFRNPIWAWMLVERVYCVWRRYRHLRRADHSFRGVLPGVRMCSNSYYYFRYLGLVLGSKPLFTRHLYTVANKATRLFCNIFSLLFRDSALTRSKKVTIYTLIIRSILSFAATVCSSTCSSNYFRLQVIQSKYLRVIRNQPRPTANSHLHYTLNVEPIRVIIYRLTANIFSHCPSPQPPSPTNRESYAIRPDTYVQEI